MIIAVLASFVFMMGMCFGSALTCLYFERQIDKSRKNRKKPNLEDDSERHNEVH